MKYASALLVVLGAGTVVRAQGNQPIVYDVCTVLGSLERHDGNVIRVRGIVETGAGSWLKPMPASKCRVPFVIKGSTFEDQIALQDPRIRPAMHTPDFETDLTSYSSLVDALRRRTDGVCVVATVVGLLGTRTPLSGLIDDKAPYKWLGFGDASIAPAQILMKSFEDIKLVDGPCRARTRRVQ